MEKITFADPENGQDLDCFIIEQTCINGINYLLVAEEDADDSLAYILKEIQTDEDEAMYVIVDDDDELEAISGVFSEMLEDIDIEL